MPTAAILPAITTISQVLGAVGTARSLFGGRDRPRSAAPQAPVAAAQAEPFVPKRPDAVERPGALSELAAFSPQQERTALATQGLNVGLGSDENAYYRNLLQRSLIGEGGQVSQDPSFLQPIESQFFSKQGVDTNNVMKFLEGIR